MVVGPDGEGPLPWLRAPLAEALARTRGHALLVHGSEGAEPFAFAVALAQAWLCESDASAKPCGGCTGCRLMQSHGHPDFLLLLPEALREPLGWAGDAESARDGEGKKAKPSREIRVEAVREAIAWSQRSPTRGGAKVIVIHPAHAMNRVTANALLKTLEEPPGALKLVLTAADPEALMPTLRSRCQRLRLRTPPRDAALAWLEAQGVAAPDALLDAAGGQPLEAQAMAQAGLSAALWRSLPGHVRAGQTQPIAALPLPRAIDALAKLCHDLMAVAAGGAPRYHALSDLGPPAQLDEAVAWSKVLLRAARHDEHPWNAALLVESLVEQGRSTWKAPAAAPRTLATLGRR